MMSFYPEFLFSSPSPPKPIPSPRSGTDNNATINIVPENALDALLDELQTFAKPMSEVMKAFQFDLNPL